MFLSDGLIGFLKVVGFTSNLIGFSKFLFFIKLFYVYNLDNHVYGIFEVLFISAPYGFDNIYWSAAHLDVVKTL